MTEAEGGAPKKPGRGAGSGPAAAKPARKRARRKSAKPAPAEPAGATPEPAPEVPPRKPPAEASKPLNELMMEQTAESLAALSGNLTQAMTRANQVFSTAFMEQAKSAPAHPDPLGVQSALNEVWVSLAQQPETLREAHANLWKRYADIWHRHTAYMLTGQQPEEEGARDKRFRDPEWRSNPAFSMLRESYLANAEFINDLIEKAEGIDEKTKRKAHFFIKQAVDAASPSNFLMTNPAALRALLQSGGESLVKGVENLATDLKRGGQGMLAISQTDLDAYKIGENVATTPGKVIFRNRVFELIQYAPTTETVHAVPLLIFPPWINKFYILDLQPKNSMIKWLLDQGHTVFLVSWVNPDEDMTEVGFEDYMREGIYAAVQAVQDATGVERLNTVGYCVGGTLLAATLAHMAKTGDQRIQSATFFASQADFKCAGDLLVFSDDVGIKFLEDKMEQQGGVLDAQTMADTFNSLRSNDLIWNYVVDNYYIGKQPPPFDLLYWNADQTRMPKALHLFYLRTFYRDNALTEGELTLLGQRLSLKDVTIPIFMQSSKEDHIAPAPSVYRSAHAFGGPVEFIVAGSGHIAGVINHPSAHKYQFWTNKNLKGALEDWFAFAHEHPGSWWPHWDQWLRERSGPDAPARQPGEGKLKPLCDAPGEYVRVRSNP